MLGKTLPMIDCILTVNKSDTSYNYRHHPRQEQTLIPDFVHKKSGPQADRLADSALAATQLFLRRWHRAYPPMASIPSPISPIVAGSGACAGWGITCEIEKLVSTTVLSNSEVTHP